MRAFLRLSMKNKQGRAWRDESGAYELVTMSTAAGAAVDGRNVVTLIPDVFHTNADFKELGAHYTYRKRLHGTRKETNSMDISPQANYTDRRAKLVSTSTVRRVSRGQRNGSRRPLSRFSRPKPLLFLLSSSSFILIRLSGPRSRHVTSQNIW
jgi:hypothetical protein